MRIVPLASMVCAAFILAACLPVTTSSPVGSTTTMAADPALAGLWKGRTSDGGDTVYFSFFPQDDGSITAVDVTPDGKDAGWGVFSLKTATLGSYRYMNVREIGTNGKPAVEEQARKTFPVLYRINGDGALVVYLLDEKRVENAIKANKIAGTIETGQFGDVAITASASDLDAFMATPDGRALFNKPLIILKREK